MKKKLVLLLCLFVALSFCFACGDKGHLGVYKEQRDGISLGKRYFLELKSGGKCEYYILNSDTETKEDAKRIGEDYHQGTYSIDGTKISFHFPMSGPVGDSSGDWTGTIHSNGRITWTTESGTVRVFIKQ